MGFLGVITKLSKKIEVEKRRQEKADLLFKHKVAIGIPSHIRIIKESCDLVLNSKNIDTKISRCKLVIERATMLHEQYETKGIRISDPDMLAVANKFKEHLIDLQKEKERKQQ